MLFCHFYKEVGSFASYFFILTRLVWCYVFLLKNLFGVLSEIQLSFIRLTIYIRSKGRYYLAQTNKQ